MPLPRLKMFVCLPFSFLCILMYPHIVLRSRYLSAASFPVRSFSSIFGHSISHSPWAVGIRFSEQSNTVILHCHCDLRRKKTKKIQRKNTRTNPRQTSFHYVLKFCFSVWFAMQGVKTNAMLEEERGQTLITPERRLDTQSCPWMRSKIAGITQTHTKTDQRISRTWIQHRDTEGTESNLMVNSKLN
jgi:hypothetical protein